MQEDHDSADGGIESVGGQSSSTGPCIAHGGMMKILLWVPIVVFALLSLGAIAFVTYQGLMELPSKKRKSLPLGSDWSAAGPPGSCTRP